jgi:hypothetical protein
MTHDRATGAGSMSYGVYPYSENADVPYVDGTSAFTAAVPKPGGSFKIDHPLDPGGKYLSTASWSRPT